MSTTERLIDRPIAQPPVEFFDATVRDRQVVRWLAYAGDRIVRRRKQEIDWLAVGGMEIDSQCVHRWGAKYIPRGYSAIVEEGANLMPMEHLRNVGAQVWTGINVDGKPQPQTGAIGFTVTFPGDAVNNILSRAHNDRAGGGMAMRNGLTELKSLYGYSWKVAHDNGDGFLDKIELECFGDGQEITLRGLEDQIKLGTAQAEDKYSLPIDVGQYRDEWLQSCSEFRDWGMVQLQREHANLRKGSTNDGLTFEYSETAELLLIQLEIVRQDRSAVEQFREQMGQARFGEAPPQPQFDAAALIELGAKLERANQRIAELESRQAAPSEPADKPLHWKVREKMEREAKLAAEQGQTQAE